MVGINHVALEVGDLDAAIAWYRQFFEFGVDLSERDLGMAFLEFGDHFLALAEVQDPHTDAERHFGLVVDVDKPTMRAALEAAGVELTPAPNCTFRDPWGNAVQVVCYDDIKFEKSERWARELGLGSAD